MSNYKPKGYPLAMRLMALEVLESLDSSPRKLEQNLDFAEEEIKAKKEAIDPLSAKEQARNYARNAGARFVILSNGNLHYSVRTTIAVL